MNELWYIHTIEYETAIKRSKLLIHSTAWMNLKSIMLSGRSYIPHNSIYITFWNIIKTIVKGLHIV